MLGLAGRLVVLEMLSDIADHCAETSSAQVIFIIPGPFAMRVGAFSASHQCAFDDVLRSAAIEGLTKLPPPSGTRGARGSIAGGWSDAILLPGVGADLTIGFPVLCCVVCI